MMIGRFFGKKVIIRTDSRPSISTKYYPGYKIKKQFRKFLFGSIEEITYYLANNIIPESPFMVQFYDYSKYNHKLFIGPLYIENLFKINKKFDDRKYNVGYVGRFSNVKGVLEFAQSLHIIQKWNSNIDVLFVGDGELKNKVEELAYTSKMRTTFVDWIENEKIPAYLNDVKLIVFPSVVEGLPNSILEAMACGSIVLSTRVGGVPDVIKDGITGFIMENNSPECIAKNVMRALEYPDLEKIVVNAKELVEREFTYKATVEKWKEILEEKIDFI
jgi:glycosyltransferase involved in cell wall biosynthesis